MTETNVVKMEKVASSAAKIGLFASSVLFALGFYLRGHAAGYKKGARDYVYWLRAKLPDEQFEEVAKSCGVIE